MKRTELAGSWVGAWCPEAVPEVDDIRPTRCRHCGAAARRGVRVVLHGHGVRTRTVVVLAATGDARAELGECWQRRYRCTACGTILVVLPAGVMPRYLYSAAAIVVALLLVEPEPVGRGLAHLDAYRHQGMYARLSAGALAEPCYRWRSLDRWSDRAPLWWPAWPGSLASLLVAFVQQAGGDALEAVVGVAVSGHVGWEGPM